MLNDVLANALSKIIEYEKLGKKECVIQPVSKIIKKVLDIMRDNGYIGDYKELEDNKGNMLVINLLGNINSCNVIKPRYSVTLDTYTKFEKRFLPADNFGILIISTPQGIMISKEAKEKKMGGKLLAVCY